MEHRPVLLAESLAGLSIVANGKYLDCTFGRGGHSFGILSKMNSSGKLLALDRDLAAINSKSAKTMLKDSRFALQHGCFSELDKIVRHYKWQGQVNGILMDLGVSSPQLEDSARGFSFLRDGRLDMRMDNSTGISVYQWLTQVNEQTLVKVLFDYGEERFAKRIARAIIQRRKSSPIQTTFELANLITDVVPFYSRKHHVATKSFQALRIKINNELEELKICLEQAIKVLCTGGRLVVISFHSLEDRIVKRFIRSETGRKFNPVKLPIKECDIEHGILQTIGKAIKAKELEIKQNPRARSAIMRIAERV